MKRISRLSRLTSLLIMGAYFQSSMPTTTLSSERASKTPRLLLSAAEQENFDLIKKGIKAIPEYKIIYEILKNSVQAKLDCSRNIADLRAILSSIAQSLATIKSAKNICTPEFVWKLENYFDNSAAIKELSKKAKLLKTIAEVI